MKHYIFFIAVTLFIQSCANPCDSSTNSKISICDLHSVPLKKVKGYYPKGLMISPEQGYIEFLVAHDKKFPNKKGDFFTLKKGKYSGDIRCEQYCEECERVYNIEYKKHKELQRVNSGPGVFTDSPF